MAGYLLLEGVHIKVAIGKVDGGVEVEDLDALVFHCLGTNTEVRSEVNSQVRVTADAPPTQTHLFILVHVTVQPGSRDVAQDGTLRTGRQTGEVRGQDTER